MGSFSLSNRIAVVTGALGLLGRQHCYAIADAGAHVVATDMDPEGCREFAAELASHAGCKTLGVGADITNPDSVRALHDATVAAFGRVDILVNNAAVNDMVENPSDVSLLKFEAYPLDAWERSLRVNVTGTFLCCQIIGAAMAKQQSGNIINIASTYGIVAPDQRLYRRQDGSQFFYKSAAYPVAKGAVLALTRFLAAYWGSSGVRVNALSPGGVQNNQEATFIANYTERTPLGRMAQPDDYRGAIVFLASDASRYMTGANLVVDGGWTII
jgi:NAD(P)-dependent dehydrogenase (short-subunit alcohol dehydrogenase family)